MKKSVFAAAAFVVALSPLAASAETTEVTLKKDETVYKFSDDDLLGNSIASNTAVIKVRPRAARVALTRPRATFIAQLLRSIENL